MTSLLFSSFHFSLLGKYSPSGTKEIPSCEGMTCFGAIYGTAPIAYAAHLGGFAFGIIAGWVVLKLNWIKRDCEQPNLKDIMS